MNVAPCSSLTCLREGISRCEGSHRREGVIDDRRFPTCKGAEVQNRVRSELPFPIAADPAVLDFQAGHASPRTTVPAPDPERLMPVLGLERLCRDAPAMASAQPAERAEQEHGFEVSVPQSSGEGTDRAE